MANVIQPASNESPIATFRSLMEECASLRPLYRERVDVLCADVSGSPTPANTGLILALDHEHCRGLVDNQDRHAIHRLECSVRASGFVTSFARSIAPHQSAESYRIEQSLLCTAAKNIGVWIIVI